MSFYWRYTSHPSAGVPEPETVVSWSCGMLPSSGHGVTSQTGNRAHGLLWLRPTFSHGAQLQHENRLRPAARVKFIWRQLIIFAPQLMHEEPSRESFWGGQIQRSGGTPDVFKSFIYLQ